MNKMGKEYQKSKRGEIDYEILWPKGYKMLYIKDTKAARADIWAIEMGIH